MVHPGVLQALFFRQVESVGSSLQQSVRPNRSFARSHCVRPWPRKDVTIWVVAAQHQLFVSCGRKVTDCEPRVAFGLQHPDSIRLLTKISANETFEKCVRISTLIVVLQLIERERYCPTDLYRGLRTSWSGDVLNSCLFRGTVWLRMRVDRARIREPVVPTMCSICLAGNCRYRSGIFIIWLRSSKRL